MCDEAVPDLFRSGKVFSMSDISDTDRQYLGRWMEEHSQPADDYLIGLFKTHRIVIFGERHNVKQHKEFIIKLIPRLYHEAGVCRIGWEFCRYADNPKLDKLLTAQRYDREAVLDLARSQSFPDWNSKEHWDILEAVWRLNKSLKPGQERMRLIGLAPDINAVKLDIVWQTKPHDSPEGIEVLKEWLKVDPAMAEYAEKDIIAPGKKALLFVGNGHDYTHCQRLRYVGFENTTMGYILHNKYGANVFQVMPHWRFSIFEDLMRERGDRAVGFNVYQSPFARMVTPPGCDASGKPLWKAAEGYVYLGSADNLHANTTIKNFITDDMFRKYREYYEVSEEREFKDAQELDEFLQKNRWPEPRALTH